MEPQGSKKLRNGNLAVDRDDPAMTLAQTLGAPLECGSGACVFGGEFRLLRVVFVPACHFNVSLPTRNALAL